MRLGYINIFVSNLSRSVQFYTEVLGFELGAFEPEFGYAPLKGGPVPLALAEDLSGQFVGIHTGVGMIVDDLEAAYRALSAKGVVFDMVPTRQPWGGDLALFQDPDGNVFYLDDGGHHA